MSEFGPTHGLTKEIRVTSISARAHPKVAFPHKHSFYQLQLITRGAGWHEVDFRRYSVRPREIFFVHPGQVHSWKLAPKTDGFIVEFSEDAVDQGSNALCPSWKLQEIPTHTELSAAPMKARKTVLNLFRLMLAEYDAQSADFEMSLRHYLIPLLIELHRLGEGRTNSKVRSDPLVDQFHFLLARNFKTEHSVSFYAKQLKMTPKALTMKISRTLGKSAGKVIRERSILEAKRLLAFSVLTISEVGCEAGFDDPSHFSHVFRKAAGVNPKEFREKAQSMN